MKSDSPQIIVNVVGPLATNSYVLYCGESSQAIVIDPGGDPDLIQKSIQERNLIPLKVVLTHGHNDHMAAAADIMKHYGIGLALHRDDLETMRKSVQDAPMWGLGKVEEPSVETVLKEGDELNFGNVSGRVMHTPGHTRGGIAILFDSVVFVGDTLFAGSVGRTDFYGGDHDTLIDSIKTKLLKLPDDTIVYSGHGPSTTIGEERKNNPFLNGSF